jgi:hypothetical protein
MKVEITQGIDESTIPDDLIEFCRELSFKYACAVNNGMKCNMSFEAEIDGIDFDNRYGTYYTIHLKFSDEQYSFWEKVFANKGENGWYLINEDLFNNIDEFIDIKFNSQKVNIIND